MINGYNAAVSGMMLASQRVNVAADNIANSTSFSKAPKSAEEYKGFIPKEVNVVPSDLGGVKASIENKNPAYSLVGTSDLQQIAAPNVDMVEEAVNLKLAENAYSANAKVVSTLADMEKETLDLLS